MVASSLFALALLSVTANAASWHGAVRNEGAQLEERGLSLGRRLSSVISNVYLVSQWV